MKTSAALASALLVLALVGCAPAAGTATTTDPDDTSTSTDADDTDGGSFQGVTLPGTGEYTIPDQAPIGGFELPDDDSQPAGCTWQLYATGGSVLAENQGTVVFLTDVTEKFVTNGCPDWVQFE